MMTLLQRDNARAVRLMVTFSHMFELPEYTVQPINEMHSNWY